MDARSQPERFDLARYPFVHEVRSRFNDTDSLGHLNNLALASFHEDARAELNRQTFGPDALSANGPFHFVLAQATIQYLVEAWHPTAFRVGVGISRFGRSSVVYSSALFRDETCVGLCDAVMVHISGGIAAPLPPDMRAILEKVAFPVALPATT